MENSEDPLLNSDKLWLSSSELLSSVKPLELTLFEPLMLLAELDLLDTPSSIDLELLLSCDFDLFLLIWSAWSPDELKVNFDF